MKAGEKYQHVDHTDVLQLGPRHVKPFTDDLVVSVFHRTTGAARSCLMDRPAAEELHAWLGQWLEEGWDGVPRECGAVLHPDPLHTWVCQKEPGHLAVPDGDYKHAGRATSWAAGETPRVMRWWTREEAER